MTTKRWKATRNVAILIALPVSILALNVIPGEPTPWDISAMTQAAHRLPVPPHIPEMEAFRIHQPVTFATETPAEDWVNDAFVDGPYATRNILLVMFGILFAIKGFADFVSSIGPLTCSAFYGLVRGVKYLFLKAKGATA